MGDDTALAATLTGTSTFEASKTGLDRIIRKEVSLGAIREMPVPENHIGLQIAPFKDVESDDVIFDYIKDAVSGGMSPARAEDSEADLARKDDIFYGQGRASIIDWAEKHRYSASDVQRYRENQIIAAQMRGVSGINLNQPENAVQTFNNRVARDDAARSRRLYNRIEWLIQQALWTNNITYNDGRIKFSVDYGRPAPQSNMAPASGILWDAGVAHDPINDLLTLQQFMFDTYGVKFARALASKKILNTFWKAEKFIPLSGMGGNPAETRVDPNYLMPNWGPNRAQGIVEDVTGIRFEEYDAVYRTRAWGSQTVVNTRFSPQDKILFLPDMGDLAEIDDTELGFGKVLTSPHPEGNWQPGFYEWEDTKKDPWMHVRGSGVKAFPVFPYLQYTATMKVLA